MVDTFSGVVLIFPFKMAMVGDPTYNLLIITICCLQNVTIILALATVSVLTESVSVTAYTRESSANLKVY